MEFLKIVVSFQSRGNLIFISTEHTESFEIFTELLLASRCPFSAILLHTASVSKRMPLHINNYTIIKNLKKKNHSSTCLTAIQILLEHTGVPFLKVC